MIYDVTADDLFKYLGQLYVEKCEAEKLTAQLQQRLIELELKGITDEEKNNPEVDS